MSIRRYVEMHLVLARIQDSMEPTPWEDEDSHLRPGDRHARFQVSVPPSDVGEVTKPVTFSLDALIEHDYRGYLDQGTIALRRLIKFGERLADCLLPEGPIRELLRNAYRNAGADRGVRLCLTIADAYLMQWPWEYVYCEVPGHRRPMGWVDP